MPPIVGLGLGLGLALFSLFAMGSDQAPVEPHDESLPSSSQIVDRMIRGQDVLFGHSIEWAATRDPRMVFAYALQQGLLRLQTQTASAFGPDTVDRANEDMRRYLMGMFDRFQALRSLQSLVGEVEKMWVPGALAEIVRSSHPRVITMMRSASADLRAGIDEAVRTYERAAAAAAADPVQAAAWTKLAQLTRAQGEEMASVLGG